MSLISAPLHALFFKRTSKGFFRSGDGGRKSFVAHSLRFEHQPKLFSLWSQKVHELEISWTCSESHSSLLTLQDIFTIYHSFGKSVCFWRHHIVPCYVVKVLKHCKSRLSDHNKKSGGLESFSCWEVLQCTVHFYQWKTGIRRSLISFHFIGKYNIVKKCLCLTM